MTVGRPSLPPRELSVSSLVLDLGVVSVHFEEQAPVCGTPVSPLCEGSPRYTENVPLLFEIAVAFLSFQKYTEHLKVELSNRCGFRL